MYFKIKNILVNNFKFVSNYFVLQQKKKKFKNQIILWIGISYLALVLFGSHCFW